MVVTTARKLRLPPNVLVIPVGSLATSSQLYRQELERAILRVLPAAQIRASLVPAVVGAALLALQQVGMTLTMDTLVSLQGII